MRRPQLGDSQTGPSGGPCLDLVVRSAEQLYHRSIVQLVCLSRVGDYRPCLYMYIERTCAGNKFASLYNEGYLHCTALYIVHVCEWREQCESTCFVTVASQSDGYSRGRT